MRRFLTRALLAACLTLLPDWAAAHPAPFSYLDIHLGDVRLGEPAMTGTLVVHDFDAAHELGLAAPESLLDAAIVARYAPALASLFAARLRFAADGQPLAWEIVGAQPLADRSAIELRWRATRAATPGVLTVAADLFPYDPNHQTFVNLYEGSVLTRQEILNTSRTSFVLYTGTRQGLFAVARAFTMSGIHHIAIGPDHILFVIGLLLLGGSVRRLLAIISAFTVGHSITLSLATLGFVNPPAHLVEPAIALSIVYVGADNLLVGGKGRDVRAWIALAFGLIHGFGFASVLRETGLPPRALGLSLFSFNFGVEIGQAVIVVLVTAALRTIQARKPELARRIVTGGSICVVAAGLFWFVQRVMI